jgi:SAM-dependent methyltransferase
MPTTGADRTEDQLIRELLAEEEFKYQRIALPGGINTPGDDRTPTLDLVLPADLSNKSVIDIGCRYGFFSFEAAKRGASRVLGVDFDKDALAKAEKIRGINKANVEFVQLDMAEAEIADKFDYVLCLNVLHHMQEPLRLLSKLIGITRECLVLEIAGFTGKDAKKTFQKNSGLTWLLYPLPLLQPVLNRLPVIMLGSQHRAFEANFFFSKEAILRLLLHQNNVFWRAKIVPSPFKGRFICIAHKLRVDSLLIVAGPSASGKTHLIEELTDGRRPDIEALVGDIDSGPWLAANPHHLDALPTPHAPKLAYHYDFLRPYDRGPYVFSRDRATDVFSLARSVASVTLICDPAVLHQRWKAREIDRRRWFGIYLGPKRSRRLLNTYGDRRKVVELYDRWIDFIAARPGSHFLLDERTPASRLRPLHDWSELRDSLIG